MYTSYIGKKFLKLYNQKENKDLTAHQFFDQVMFPLFFDDDKHLMHVSNSPFFQKPSKEFLKSGLSKSHAQLAKLHSDIANDPPNMAIFVGYAAKDIKGVTSGQISDLRYKIDAEEIYSSWIGEALAVGVGAGFAILLDKDEVLLALYEGWAQYRKYLSQTPNLKDKQIETWNGHWLCNVLNKSFTSINEIRNPSIESDEVQGKISIPTKKWPEVIFSLSKKYPGNEIIVYAYNLSQTNTTLGFIKILLPEIRRLYECRDRLFINKGQSILSDNEIETLETFYNFRSACSKGVIGLRSLEPRELRVYMPAGTYQYSQGKAVATGKENSFYKYNIIKLWIIAMLNKTELLDLACEVAGSILTEERTAQAESRGKTNTSHESGKVLESRSVKNFIENLTETIKRQPGNAEVFRKVVKEVLKMPVDNFPLFITLIKFEYYYQKQSGN